MNPSSRKEQYCNEYNTRRRDYKRTINMEIETQSINYIVVID